jgi:2-polyprenyl-3-methyl-5-hydroxy-6-metoxy-1,4-benzoquinol methylase
MKSRNLIQGSSLERIIPENIESTDTFNHETLLLHLARYKFAQNYITSGFVLDIACGVGYGSAYIAENCPNVQHIMGVDLDIQTIKYAQTKYAHPKIDFIQGDATKFEAPQVCETIISLETLEHLPAPQDFLKHLIQFLSPTGTLIVSVPTTFSTDANPYHLSDFTPKSFRKIITNLGMEEVDCLEQKQIFSPFKILKREEERLSELRQNLLLYYLKNPMQAWRRMKTTLQYGFNNHYLTIAARKK